MSTGHSAAEATRDRIVAATAKLLDEGEPEAVSTRAVGAGGERPSADHLPALRRQAGRTRCCGHPWLHDLRAEQDRSGATADPVEDLRTGGICTSASVLPTRRCSPSCTGPHQSGQAPPRWWPQARSSPGASIASQRPAVCGSRGAGAQLVHAAGCGTTLTLIAMPEEHRDPGLSDLAREAVIAAITNDASVLPEPGPGGVARPLIGTLPSSSS